MGTLDQRSLDRYKENPSKKVHPHIGSHNSFAVSTEMMSAVVAPPSALVGDLLDIAVIWNHEASRLEFQSVPNNDGSSM